MAYPITTAAGFEAALDDLVARYPGRCTKNFCANTTFKNQRMSYVRIVNPSATGTKVPVLLVGGIHAREQAPPDALVSFVDTMLGKGTRGTPTYRPRAVVYPRLIRPADDEIPGGAVRFERATVDVDTVTAVLNKVDLYVLPLGNPDGRNFIFESPRTTNKWQRKNLHDFGLPHCDLAPATPTEPGVTLDVGKGVDINRNFDIGWDAHKYFDPDFLKFQVHFADTPCGNGKRFNGEIFGGNDHAISEAETKNIVALQESTDARFYMDVHLGSRDKRSILYAWQNMHTQTGDASLNYQNNLFDLSRDDDYGEYLPERVMRAAAGIGGNMRTKILEMATTDSRLPTFKGLSSEYVVSPDITAPRASNLFDVPLYPAPGASTDHVTARQLSKAPKPVAGYTETPVPPERYAFTFEGSSSFEGKFWPDATFHYPKIEREIHLAVWVLLAKAAASAGAPTLPSP